MVKKNGLYLNEAPEPLFIINCYDCKEAFYTDYEFRKHKKTVHGIIHCWVKYKTTFKYEGSDEEHSKIELTKEWVKVTDNPTFSVPYYDFVGRRPTQRILYTTKELSNRRKKKCHCGKPPTPPRRKYCSDDCANSWYGKKIFSSQHRNNYLGKHSGTCEHCGKTYKDSTDLEMDHIIAIIFRGHPWDERNLQGICYDCHKIKSASDMKILAWYKRVDKFYDIGLYK